MKIEFESLIGTTIEYFDGYIFGTAAMLVFPKRFFPSSDPTMAMRQSLAAICQGWRPSANWPCWW
jgi:hypothetical protein